MADKHTAMSKLDTEPYKGVRDFYPKDMYVFRYISDTMSRVAESFGYSEYGASILEPSELYRSKTSEEIVNEQTYSFIDRGQREVTLRPEMTPTLARMVAGRKNELSFPLRWYTIANVFRYERPQRGRVREHWQLNADIFGVPGIEAEIEIILLLSKIMRAFGAQESDFEIRLNDRNIFSDIFNKLSIAEERQVEVMRLLDKRAKIDNFEIKLEEILGKQSQEFMEKMEHASSSASLEKVLSGLQKLGIRNATVDTSIVRGFDYYTGIVFEVFDTSSENNRSLFGGGRYDNLLELFGEERIPAVGFGVGDVTMRDFLETHGLLPEHTSRTDLYLCSVTEESRLYTQELAESLRAQDLNVEVSLADKKVGDQVKLADKKRIPFIICVGENEVNGGNITIKHLKSGEEKTLPRESVADYIFEQYE